MYATEQAQTIGLPLEATIGVVKGFSVGLVSEHPARIVKIQSIEEKRANLAKVSRITVPP
jgi:hypothetical protein